MIRVNVKAEVDDVFRDLGRLKRDVERVTVQSLNAANKRKLKPHIVRGIKARFGAPNAKSIRKQVRIPKSFLARRGRLVSAGLYDVSLPRILHDSGAAFQIRRGLGRVTPGSEPFLARMPGGRSRRRGWFARVIGQSRRPWRSSAGGRYRTELPIAELYTDVTGPATPIVESGIEVARAFFASEFGRRFEMLAARANARRSR